jgi:hypothetical protein
VNVRGLATTSESGYVSEHTEEWRPVLGYEGKYEVSNLGRVRSLPRRSPHGDHWQTIPGRMLKAGVSRGYPTVTLWANGAMELRRVHRLVCEAFLGPRPAGLDTRHLDGDGTNCRVENLQYGTRTENIRDQLLHGTHRWAFQTHCNKGHEYTTENTYIRLRNGHSSRVCRTCARAAGAAHYRKKRREAAA